MPDLKQEIMADIQSRVPVFKRTGIEHWIIRCPICGDSQKDYRHAHCYIKCSDDPSEPILYYCHRCNAHGRVTSSFLEKLHVRPELISMIGKQKYNRIGVFQKCNLSLTTGAPAIESPQAKYITIRLGGSFTSEDLDRLKVVWDMTTIREHVPQRISHILPSNHDSISFLSDDMSTLITRTFDDEEPRWNKLKLFKSDNKSFYTIRSTVDLFTQEPIELNVAEGIFDIISVYQKFNSNPNGVFIATLGSNYMSAVNYAISKGFIGSNIILKIYIDWGIDEGLLKKTLRKYKWLFREIYVYKNLISKDVGVPMDQIKLSEYQI